MKAVDRSIQCAMMVALATLTAAGAGREVQQPPQQADDAQRGAVQQPRMAPQQLAPRSTTITPQSLRPTPRASRAPEAPAPQPSQQQRMAPPRTQPRTQPQMQPQTQQIVPQPSTRGALQPLPQPVPLQGPRTVPEASTIRRALPDQSGAAARSTAAGYAVNARVFLASQPSRGGNEVGTSELGQEEKNLCSYIPYKNYKLVKSGSKSLQTDQAITVNIARNYSVSVTPMSDKGGQVTARIVWRTPDGRTWAKTLAFTRGVQSMVGGPNVDGGIYLLSLVIR